ncbi:MAG: hypothetical protein IJ214_09760 [Clostridia bacterium]|nr:hypothetical protein [Clostridia bacterium]
MKATLRLFLAVALLAVTLLLCGTALADNTVWPATGQDVKKNGKMKLDVSYTSNGYFMAAVQSKNKHKLKLRVVKSGETLTYDLNGNGDYEVFPLQLGNGKYEISLYENVSGKKYSQEGKVTISVSLKASTIPFLGPNQYVNYTRASEAVAKAADICAGKSGKEAFDAVCGFMKSGFVYDYVKAVTIKAGVLPDIDGSYKKKMGVCQDLAAIMACMLRTQGIPSKLMIGYADKQYHAWTVTVINGEEVFYDPTAALNAISKVKEYTLERFY